MTQKSRQTIDFTLKWARICSRNLQNREGGLLCRTTKTFKYLLKTLNDKKTQEL